MTEKALSRREFSASLDTADYLFDRLHAEYDISSFTEESNPEFAFRAQQIQGQSYVESGFVHESALDEWGRLRPELDKSRGDNILYYLGVSRRDERNQAAVRLVEKSKGMSLNELPAYSSSLGVMTAEYKQLLELHEERTGGKVQEVSGLSNTGKSASLGSFEVIREILQRSIRNDSSDIWIITFVPSAYRAMRSRFGDRVVERISANLVEIDKVDRHMPSELELTPVIVRTAEVLDNLLTSVEDAPSDRHSALYTGTLEFMSDGLHLDELSPRVREHLLTRRALGEEGMTA